MGIVFANWDNSRGIEDFEIGDWPQRDCAASKSMIRGFSIREDGSTEAIPDDSGDDSSEDSGMIPPRLNLLSLLNTRASRHKLTSMMATPGPCSSRALMARCLKPKETPWLWAATTAPGSLTSPKTNPCTGVTR